MIRHAWSGGDDGDSLSRAVEQPVGLADHDAHWADAFAVERERLMRLFPGTFVEIAHIGSTPVDGMCAKPIIDLLAGVRSMDEAFALNDPLCANGYSASREFNRSVNDRQFFMRHAGGHRTHHLHVVVHGSEGWRERIEFCRLLQQDPEVRLRYEALKRSLAECHAADREAYTEGKSEFIRAAIDNAGASWLAVVPRTTEAGHRSTPMSEATAYPLHCFAQSGNAYKVALMLELAGADWTPVWLDFFNGGTRDPAFRALNPMAEIPVLEHEGRTLTQSGMILDYLSGTLGRYGPADEDERREILRWTLWDNHKLTSPIATLRWMLNFAPEASVDPAVIAWLRVRSKQALKTLDGYLGGRRYVVADRLTTADLSLIGYLYFPTEFGVDWNDYPAIGAWTARIAAEPRWKHPYDLMPGHPLPQKGA